MLLNHNTSRSGVTALAVLFLAASQTLATTPVKPPTPAKPTIAATKTAPNALAKRPGTTSTPGSANSAAHKTTGASGAGSANHANPGATSAGRTTVPPGRTPTGGSQTRTFKSPNGGEARFGAKGEVRSARVNGMTITHGPGGSREVMSQRGGVRVVSHAGGRGYVQHGYLVGHDRFEHRSYVYHGARYERFYRPYFYRGVALDVYLPRYYYGPAFYGWVYAPWAVPVRYNWAFTASPWFAFYGGYFAPYPVYASPSLWLTDYLIASSLQQAYQARVDAQVAGAQAGGPPQAAAAPLSPDVKEAIAEEIRRQIALENAEQQTVSQNAAPDAGSSGINRMLGDNTAHVFVVGAALTLNSNVGECAVTEGDVLQLAGAPEPNATTAALVVLASKGTDCAKGATVSVAFNDLQEMQNHMRETIDQGMGEIRSRQGQAGLPAAPASTMTAPVQASYAALAPPPDANAAAEVNQQTQESEVAEKDLVAQALAGPNNGAASGFAFR